MQRKAVLTLLFLAATGVAVADWPAWLGPEQNGRAPETGLLGNGSASLKVAWDRPLGIAYSAVALADGKAVTMYGDGETDWLIALDQETGAGLWRYRMGPMFPKVGGAAGGQSSMPIIDGKTVFVMGADGTLFAVSADDGKELWKVALHETVGAKQPRFGFATSPLVVGKLLFVQAGGKEGHSLLALNKKNGKLKWSTGDDSIGYQSPILARVGGADQIVASTDRAVVGLSPKTGRELWRFEHGVTERSGSSTPVRVDEERFLLTGQNESVIFRVTHGDDGFATEETWRGDELKRSFATPVVHEGHVYGYDGKFLTCLNADTGEQLWKTRSRAAGLILIDGHLALFGSDGAVVVGRADPTGFVEKARIQIDQEGGFTYPSFTDGSIFVRNEKKIARVDVVSN